MYSTTDRLTNIRGARLGGGGGVRILAKYSITQRYTRITASVVVGIIRLNIIFLKDNLRIVKVNSVMSFVKGNL